MEKTDRIITTKNFLRAVEHLKDEGIITTARELQEKTGIVPQRITGMKAFIEKGGKATYANQDQIERLNKIFNVRYEFIFKGEEPIIREKLIEKKEIKNQTSELLDMQAMKNEILFLKEKVNFLNEKVNFLFEKLKR